MNHTWSIVFLTIGISFTFRHALEPEFQIFDNARTRVPEYGIQCLQRTRGFPIACRFHFIEGTTRLACTSDVFPGSLTWYVGCPPVIRVSNLDDLSGRAGDVLLEMFADNFAIFFCVSLINEMNKFLQRVFFSHCQKTV